MRHRQGPKHIELFTNEAFKTTPDEEGIETRENVAISHKRRGAFKTTPDEEGIETPCLASPALPRRAAFKTTPDEEGIETRLFPINVELAAVGLSKPPLTKKGLRRLKAAHQVAPVNHDFQNHP